ncbi:MAG: D-2-hydroxyacid dehydrogenase family protein [Acidimicrobiales bacterium]
MKVAILDDYFDTLRSLECFGLLADHDVTVLTRHVDSVDELARLLEGVGALVLIRERTAVTAQLLERLPDLELISQRSVFPHVDVDACTRLGVLLCSDLHAATASVAAAELTWALVLAASRQIPAQAASLRAGTWQSGVGRSLSGRTLGVYGYGRIGRVVAGYGAAFAMRVVVWSNESSRERARADGVAVAVTRDELFEGSDVLTVHLRLVDATRGVISARDLGLMKPDALFVNTSRAGLVEPGALVEALRAGRPGGAAVDVFDTEPLTDPADPLVSLEGVIATPHIGYVTREEWELQFRDVFRQVNDYAAGSPTNAVNPEALLRRP